MSDYIASMEGTVCPKKADNRNKFKESKKSRKNGGYGKVGNKK